MNIQAVNQNFNVSKTNFKGSSYKSSQPSGSSSSFRNKAALLAALEMLAIFGLSGCGSKEVKPVNVDPMPIITQDVENPDSPLVYEQKLDAIKEAIPQISYSYGDFVDQLWENFPAIYEATKDLEGSKPDDFLNNFEFFYNSQYKTITAIAAKGEKPWEGVTTAAQANQLLSNIIREATTSPSWCNAGIAMALTCGTDVNDGEYDALMKAIDGLSGNDSPAVQQIAQIYRSAVEAAIAKTDSKIEGDDYESRLAAGSPGADKAVDAYDAIRAQLDAVQESRKAFDELFASFLAGEAGGEGAFQKPCEAYTTAFSSLMAKCGLSVQTQNPNTVIDNQFLSSQLNEAQDAIYAAMGIALIPIEGDPDMAPEPVPYPTHTDAIGGEELETSGGVRENGTEPRGTEQHQ